MKEFAAIVEKELCDIRSHPAHFTMFQLSLAGVKDVTRGFSIDVTEMNFTCGSDTDVSAEDYINTLYTNISINIG